MPRILLAFAFILTACYPLRSQTLVGASFGGGANKTGTLNKFIADIRDLNVQKSFDAASFAAYPGRTNLVQANNGLLYGMTTSGGINGYGVLFSYDALSSSFTKVRELSYADGALPFGSLIQATDGKLYGLTSWGGSLGFGTMFSFDPASSAFAVVQQFDSTNGSNPSGSLIQAADGKLYGMTQAGGSSNSGVIFSYDITGAAFSKLADLDPTTGSAPTGNLCQANDGKLYGLTSSGGSNSMGTVFSFDTSSNGLIKLIDFDGTNGAWPFASLTRGIDGKLYGCASAGGANNLGVLFSYETSSSTYTDLKDFDYDGNNPMAALIQGPDGIFYGTTAGGGFNGAGTIYSFDPVLSSYTKLMDFNFPQGGSPEGSLFRASNGKFYGLTTTGGGADNNSSFGVIYSFDLSTAQYRLEKALASNRDGSNVAGSLVRGKDGKLFGMTTYGGAGGWGTIFSFDEGNSSYTKLKDFDYSNGSHPFGSLLQASDGKFYGVTANGGDKATLVADDYDIGVLFSFDPTSGNLNKLMRFDDRNLSTGSSPYGSLVQATDGKLYGMTSWGGDGDRGFGQGVIFSYDLTNSKYTRLRDFLSCGIGCLDNSDSNGISPYGSLVQAKDGKLYGMTSAGGKFHFGVLFSYNPASGDFSKLFEFDSTNGSNPYGSLIQARDGKLYGMSYGGGSHDAGVVFSWDPIGKIFTKLNDLDFAEGAHPYGNLLQASDGKLYGMTSSGGNSDNGVIFSFDPVSGVYSKLLDYDGQNGSNPYFGSAFIELPELSPLPVSLLSFTGTNQKRINELSWQVSNEQDLAYYELQRSTDGQNFSIISQFKANGKSSYEVNDTLADMPSPYYFYRLKMLDANGNFEYSEVIKISLGEEQATVFIGPNPFTESIRVTMQSAVAQNAIFRLSDFNGRELLRQEKALNTGTNLIPIGNLKQLVQGVYVLTIMTSERSQSFKVVKSE